MPLKKVKGKTAPRVKRDKTHKQKQRQKQNVNVVVHIDNSKKTGNRGSNTKSIATRQTPSIHREVINTFPIFQDMYPNRPILPHPNMVGETVRVQESNAAIPSIFHEVETPLASTTQKTKQKTPVRLEPPPVKTKVDEFEDIYKSPSLSKSMGLDDFYTGLSPQEREFIDYGNFSDYEVPTIRNPMFGAFPPEGEHVKTVVNTIENERETVMNPFSKRQIYVNGPAFKHLIKEGFTYSSGKLHYPEDGGGKLGFNS
jgi:hypothetical protein